ncbi:MAG: hypothetical protein OHK0017_05510 [Patescibacteria group bacterium]
MGLKEQIVKLSQWFIPNRVATEDETKLSTNQLEQDGQQNLISPGLETTEQITPEKKLQKLIEVLEVSIVETIEFALREKGIINGEIETYTPPFVMDNLKTAHQIWGGSAGDIISDSILDIENISRDAIQAVLNPYNLNCIVSTSAKQNLDTPNKPLFLTINISTVESEINKLNLA